MSNKNNIVEAIWLLLKRIVLWVLLGLVSLVLLIFVFINVINFSLEDHKSPQKINGLNGINLNQSLSDFLFKFEGFKKEVVTDRDGKESKEIVFYSNDRYVVYFRNQKIEAVEDYCQSVLVDEKGINGIRCGDSSDKILEKYKEKIKIFCGKENLRLFISEDYNIAYTLRLNKVIRIRVEDKINYDNSWVDCKDYKI